MPQGKFKSILGTANSATGPVAPGMLASRTTIAHPMIATGPDGTLYFLDSTASNIQLLKSAKPSHAKYNGDNACLYQVPSEDGRQFFCFDAKGRHWKTIDSKTKGVVYTFGYTSNLLSSITDAAGRPTTITRAGTTVTIKGPYGQSTIIGTSGGYATSIQGGANGLTTTVTHNSQGLLTSFKPGENTTPYTFTYDGLGRLQLDSDPEGGSQTFDRSSNGVTSTVTRTTNLGRSTSYSLQVDPYGGQQRTVKGADKLSNLMASGTNIVTVASDDPMVGRQSKTTMADGTVIHQIMDSSAQWGSMAPHPLQTKITLPTVGSTTLVKKTLHYDCFNDVAATCPDDPTPGASSSGAHTASEVVNINGRKTLSSFDIDAAQNKTYRVVSPMNRMSSYTVDSAGRLLSFTPAGDATPAGSPVNFGYSGGQLTTITQGSRVLTLGYAAGTGGGAAGYLQSIQDPGATPASTVFSSVDSLGNAGSAVRKRGTTALGQSASFGWDNAGRLTSVTPPGQSAHGLGYSQVGLLKSYTPPTLGGLASGSNYDYSRDRELDLVRLPGTSVDYVYDPSLGRLTQVRFPEDSVSFDYYASAPCVGCGPGHLKVATVASSNHATTFSYDGMLLTGVKQASTLLHDSMTTTWSYDQNFWLVSEKLDKLTGATTTTTTVTYDHDSDGIVKCASLGLCTDAKALTIIPWDYSARPKTIKQDAITEDRVFNTQSEPKTQVVKKSGAALMSINYEPTVATPRDAFGRVTDREETINGATKSFHYSYDDFGRLYEVRSCASAAPCTSGEVVGHYVYDDNGNRASGTSWKNAAGQLAQGTFQYDAQDRLISFTSSGGTPSSTFEYTPAGVLTRKGGATSEYRFAYDARGSLRSALTPTGQIDYTVDAFGRRVSRNKNLNLDRQWAYAMGGNPIAEIDATGKVTRFVYASSRIVPDFMATSDGTIYRLLTDQLGSVRLVVRSSDGAIMQELEYDAFGNVLKDTHPQFQPFGFAGGLYDPDTQLVRFGARDYDPSVGRWTSKDPILFDGRQTNLYVYAGNDPINRIDPSGLTDGAGGMPGSGDGGNEGAGGSFPDDPEPAVCGNEFANCWHDCMEAQGADYAAEMFLALMPIAPTPKTAWELSKTLAGGAEMTTWASRVSAGLGMAARNPLRGAGAAAAEYSALPYAFAAGYVTGSAAVCSAECG